MIVYDVAREWLARGYCPIIVAVREDGTVPVAVSAYQFTVDESAYKEGVPMDQLVEKAVECYARAQGLLDD